MTPSDRRNLWGAALVATLLFGFSAAACGDETSDDGESGFAEPSESSQPLTTTSAPTVSSVTSVPAVASAEELFTTVLEPVIGCTDFVASSSESSGRSLGDCTTTNGDVRFYVYDSESLRLALGPDDDNYPDSGSDPSCSYLSVPDFDPAAADVTILVDNWSVRLNGTDAVALGTATGGLVAVC